MVDCIDIVLSVFVSSTQNDLQPERAAARRAILRMGMQPVLAEDFVTSALTPRKATVEQASNCDVYVGIFWKRYGDAPDGELSPTENEYRAARTANRPTLMYVKEAGLGQRHIHLDRFLREVQDYREGHFRSSFADAQELEKLIERDLIGALETMIRGSADSQVPASAPDLGGVASILSQRILIRTERQLHPKARKYNSEKKCLAACSRIASRIRRKPAIPECAVAWSDNTGRHDGSVFVGEALAADLGIPLVVLDVEEVGEMRKVVSDCSFAASFKRILMVDDAAYSGRTLRELGQALKTAAADVEVTAAVLAAKSGSGMPPGLTADTIGDFDDMLFPWGWSRNTRELYDAYALLNIRDRTTVSVERLSGSSLYRLDDEFSGDVSIMDLEGDQSAPGGGSALGDSFLYVLFGAVSVKLGGAQGLLTAGEHLFIPRGIPFQVSAVKRSAKILQLVSKNVGTGLAQSYGTK